MVALGLERNGLPQTDFSNDPQVMKTNGKWRPGRSLALLMVFQLGQ